MELNGTEVDLINQIAKKHKKEIKYGDWYEFKGRLYLYKNNHPLDLEISLNCIPVWTVADCLKFVKDNNYYYSIYDQVGGGTVIDIFILVNGSRQMQEQLHGGTLLEACLLAVLVILQDNEVLKSSGIIRKN